jgi:hypothetical protein
LQVIISIFTPNFLASPSNSTAFCHLPTLSWILTSVPHATTSRSKAQQLPTSCSCNASGQQPLLAALLAALQL